MASARPQRFDPSAIRKKDETEELLVFGYSCKLFRDDEKALYIDQGKHLIPWMGDDTLKIDRYDVRGTVYDLRPLEPLGGGASDALWSTLSDAERKVEQLCDEERYRALYHNEAEEAMYQEEELKRLHKALDPQNSYGQVPFSYDNETEQDESAAPSNKEPNDEAAEEEDEPFIPPQELDIPVGMVLPERTKLNAIIEKTASFINTQGPQMEIILKMKQANNPQFSFLSFDCPLHAYYRHLLMAIKTGRYRTRQEKKQQEQNDLENSDHYLHPSLATAPKPVELAPSIPSISYKPSADCAYSMLVNKFKDRQAKLTDDTSGSSSPGDGTGQNDSPLDPSTIIAPPSEIQVIIDKMASYVIKNGRDFESVVRNKGDERFAFLDPGHQYHRYYDHKVRVYQGLEQPRNFTQGVATASKNTGTPNPIQNPIKKKPPQEKNKRPILLPGYEYSDDSSESEGDESDTEDSRGKPKLAPVCFSIKKPKEAEILKEVKSALPVEEESSEEDVEGDGETAPKPSSSAPDTNPIDVPPPALPNREEEMKRLQQLLKEKERQLKEQERLRKISEKRSQDIFQIESTPKPSLPPLPESAPPPPLPPPVVVETLEPEPKCAVETHETLDIAMPEEIKIVGNETSATTKKNETETKVKPFSSDDLLKEISETEIIDLTEDAPKISDTTRLERKRKAAAFLSRLQKDRPFKRNGASCPASDSDAASRHSTPSPTYLKREKLDSTLTSFHEAGIPKTSLMARLAASTEMSRQRKADKNDVSKEKSSQRKSESPVKSSKEREEKSHHRQRRKKDSSSPSELEHDRSRSRSRSMSYSRSPSHKRRQGDDSDTEYRSHRHHKEGKSSHRKKYDAVESIDPPREHNRHHRRHEEERRSHSYSHSHNSNRSRGHSHTQGRTQSNNHSRKTDVQGSDSDSTD
ncbi:splicing factor, suppressor of white-apricot homolog isoform X2 [Thrips palmi]|uniref:Splicing factor, suppressor of white-apricot homolog isoform X2 n=1 Tax=Thrips palmi TaxID=161013 RepID=A0A6P8ZKV8_THRPL|nr:splicing factor, suppressor of white-apricot homolog isoform X2 [Thrips palmi]